MPDPLKSTDIKKRALEAGFDDVGITQAYLPAPDLKSLSQYLQEGYQGDLSYMENKVRFDLEEFLPGAKSVIMLLSYYRQKEEPFRPDAGLIASYARGRDYHKVHQKRLKKLIQWIEELAGEGVARPFSDAQPVMERTLAVQAGLGWFGKSGLLIHRRFGTYTLLAGILTTLELEGSVHDTRQRRCGSCTRCIDACPTGAIRAPYTVDASRCLSYHLIESKKNIPEEIAKKNPGYIFGCDICQKVCPHNVRKPISPHEEFSPSRGCGTYLGADELVELQPEKLHGTPLQRRKKEGLLYNAETLHLL